MSHLSFFHWWKMPPVRFPPATSVISVVKREIVVIRLVIEGSGTAVVFSKRYRGERGLFDLSRNAVIVVAVFFVIVSSMQSFPHSLEEDLP
mmetsp:Transcript_61672/g.85782  ORF Transcript_61672/g.85782 Transcript_61672/m.85782 type:complete len:91 (-) Transcript_61672:562-834(-)